MKFPSNVLVIRLCGTTGRKFSFQLARIQFKNYRHLPMNKDISQQCGSKLILKKDTRFLACLWYVSWRMQAQPFVKLSADRTQELLWCILFLYSSGESCKVEWSFGSCPNETYGEKDNSLSACRVRSTLLETYSLPLPSPPRPWTSGRKILQRSWSEEAC